MKPALSYIPVTAFICLLAFTCQMFGKAFIIADYYANTKAYAKNCVNKARPKMRCNGKCQMMKKLQEEEKKEQESQERKADSKNEVPLSSKSFFASLPDNNAVRKDNKLHFPRSDGHAIDRSYSIFHPPLC